MNKSVYSLEQREEALRISDEIGPTAAAKELGLPAGTVYYWRHQRSKQEERSVSEAIVKVEPENEQSSQDNEPATNAGKRVAKIYTPSQRAEILEYAAKHGISEASREFGATRFSIYSWRRKMELHSEGKLKDSPVTGSDEDPRLARDRRILKEWKSHPGLGPSQIRNQLRRDGLKVSVHTVRCVMEEHGYVTPKVRRREVHDQTYEAVRPNHLWHLDFLHRHVHKQKVYVLLVLDDWLCCGSPRSQ